MTTGIASGLGATLGVALEATVGTGVTPTVWIPHNKAQFSLKKNTVVSQALHGSRFLQATRRNILSYSVDGSLDLDVTDRQMGKLLQVGLGSTPGTPTTLGAGAYLQTHVPGIIEGQSLTVQKGEPALPGGVIQAFTYNGVKILDWTVSVARGGLAKYSATLDGWQEATATAYTAATYLAGASAPHVFSFNQGALLLGGALTLNATTLSSSTGTVPTATISSFECKFTNKFATDRFPLGATVKKEQISNAFSEIAGSIELEFANLTDYYNAFQADTTMPLLFTMTGPTALVSTFYPTFQIAISAAKFDAAPITEQGPDIIKVKVPFTAYDDGSGNTAQVQYISADSTV